MVLKDEMSLLTDGNQIVAALDLWPDAPIFVDHIADIKLNDFGFFQAAIKNDPHQ